jgi:cytochrome c-type biogenesis protein CcmE
MTEQNPNGSGPNGSRPTGLARGAWKYALGMAVIVGAVGWMLSSSLTANLNFFLTPSEYLLDESKYAGRRVMLGGVVEPGSVAFDKEKLKLSFVVSDGTAQFKVLHSGTPPELFKAGTGVTIEGKLEGSGTSAVFQGERLLVKHSEEYRAPKPGEKVNYGKALEFMKDSR